MDNSRIISSYKKRARDASNSQDSGMVAKFRRFISPWSQENNNASAKVNSTTHIDDETTINTTINREQSFLKRNVSIPGTFGSPNKVISSFFEEKGEEPLTEVEYEGIVSLINKSRNFTPNQSQIDEKSLNIIKPRKVSQQIQTSSRKPSMTSELFNTPYTQRTIKANNSAIFSTPDYTPRYHTIQNTSMPSIKRVYQFSGLPSPYRTKIKPPSTNKRKVSGNTTVGSITTILEKSPSTKRPRSDAANTLLSILDGNDGKKVSADPEQKSAVASFVNPYKANNRKKRSTITANDINKTISYDKSEKLPETEDKNKLEKKSQMNGTMNNGNSTVSTPPINSKPIETEPKQGKTNGFSFNFGPSSVPSTTTPAATASTTPASTTPAPTTFAPAKANGSEDKIKSNNVATISTSENSAKSILPDTKATLSATKPFTSEFDFVFPVVQSIEVSLDQDKIKKYESLFSF